jgi:integrase
VGHVVDRWTVPGPGGRRVKGPRHGRGKRWLARWVEPGGAERSRAFASKDAAAAHVAQVDVDVRGGSYVRRTDTTFKAFATEWLSHQVHQSPGTAKLAESRLRLYAFEAIGHKPLPSVTRGDVQGVITAATATLGPGATRILYVYLRAVFAAAVEDRLVPISPCRRINLPPVRRELAEPLDASAIRVLAEQVPAHLRGAVWLGAGTGLRPGELRGLTADRLDGDTIRVDRQLTDATRAASVVFGPLKTESSYRSLQLAPSTHKRLLEHMEGHPPGPAGLIFTSARRAPLRRSQLQYAWERGSRGLGLPERSGWHDLRHHHASLLIAKGLSPRAVADRLGHADPAETLRVYSHLWPSDSRRILEAIEAVHSIE